MTRAAFANGAPAIVSASRSILYPKRGTGDWKDDVLAATLAMKADLTTVTR
jgi:hypothetical protein